MIGKAPCWTSSKAFTNRFPGYVDEYETLLTDNRIWKQRLVGIGVVGPGSAPRRLGMTGPMLRGLRCRVGPAQSAAV
jgi:NADH:ubiquinone oxidoreductase subunit D